MKIWAVFLAVIATLVMVGPASADAACTNEIGLEAVASTCVYSADEVQALVSTPSTTATYSVNIVCLTNAEAGVCANPRVCAEPPGSVLYNVVRVENGGPPEVVGTSCLNTPPDGGPPVITPGMVAAQFQAIKWPESPLTIQPPGGRTLVNLATNFFTDNVGPRVQPVTLLGQRVEIEATPTTWVWHHGDGTDQTTTEPGAAYPELDITHTYLDADVTVAPSVDTTYAGRYRVNGGPWITIPATVTIAGAAGALEVVPAKPQLVAAP